MRRMMGRYSLRLRVCFETDGRGFQKGLRLLFGGVRATALRLWPLPRNDESEPCRVSKRPLSDEAGCCIVTEAAIVPMIAIEALVLVVAPAAVVCAASRCIDWRWDCRRLGNSSCCHGSSPPVPLLGSGV